MRKSKFDSNTNVTNRATLYFKDQKFAYSPKDPINLFKALTHRNLGGDLLSSKKYLAHHIQETKENCPTMLKNSKAMEWSRQGKYFTGPLPFILLVKGQLTQQRPNTLDRARTRRNRPKGEIKRTRISFPHKICKEAPYPFLTSARFPLSSYQLLSAT